MLRKRRLALNILALVSWPPALYLVWRREMPWAITDFWRHRHTPWAVILSEPIGRFSFFYCAGLLLLAVTALAFLFLRHPTAKRRFHRSLDTRIHLDQARRQDRSGNDISA